MTDWVRLWHDMPTDPKWRTIARKSGQRVGDVIAVFTFMLVNASGNASERGTLHNLQIEDVASALDIDDADVEAILRAMSGKVIDGDRLTGWDKRQPKREDSSAFQRKEAWKERQRNAAERSGTQQHAPETETETEVIEASASITRKRANDAFPMPDGVDPQHWRDFLANRKRKRLSNTATAHQRLIADLARIADDEWPPGRLIEHAAAKGWGGIYDPREGMNNGIAVVSAGSAADRGNRRGGRADPAVDLYRQACAELAAEGAAANSEDRRGDWLSLPPSGSG